LETNSLYRNDGAYYSETSFKAGIGEISLNYLGFGTGFFDYDNDGHLDLFVGNGHVHDNIGDYDELVTYAQRAQIFRNTGSGRFVETTAGLGAAFAERYVVRGSSFGDIDLDGDLDIAVVSNGRRFALLRNEGRGGNWLQVELAGQAGNRDAIGARIYLEAGGSRQLRQIKAGSGFLSTSQRAPIFGLGTALQVEKLEVVWPSGARQIHRDIAANQRLQITQKAP
ncbi:MAG: CRTAC1 family protein, partial [Candidatus Latescibacteria bacterium]|nr:CRTAC1 family protein [Candidatus Latescibacterota bacterium]